MINVSSNFKTLAAADTREVDYKIIINGVTYGADKVISCNISRSIGDSGMQIGNTISDRLTAQIHSSLISSGKTVKPYVKFGNAEWLQLGVFTVTQSQSQRGVCEIEAYDKMYFLDKRCTFLGTTSGSVAPLEFPATMQQMLSYVCDTRGLTCDFECQPFEIQERPIYDEGAYGDNKYYTHRDIISFIASAHGANAKFNNAGELVFSVVGQSIETIAAADCISQTIGHEEGFTVEGIRFIVGNDELFINDEGSTYNDDLEGIIQIDNPLASIEIAEYVWNTLGGFTYYTCNLEQRARGYFETGDVITINGFEGLYSCNIVVQSLELNISADAGFNEVIGCTAETSAESANRGASGATSSPQSMQVYYDVSAAAQTIPTDGTMRGINAVTFAAKVNCIPLYAATVQLDLTAAGTVKLHLVYDGNTIGTYQQYFTVGKQLMTITCPLLNVTNGTHKASLFIASADAAGTAEKGCYATVSGSGLAAQAGWDGTITTVEEFSAISFYNTISIAEFTEELTTKKLTPIAKNIVISMPATELSGDVISIKAVAETAGGVIEDIPHEIVSENVSAIALTNTVSIGTFTETITTTEE